MDYTGNTNSLNVDCFNNINSFNNIVNTTVADEKPQVLRWLSPLQPQKRHEDLRGNRLDDVGQWIFQTGEFGRWNTGENGSDQSVLFCHGDPGVGKTYLSSLVIDHFYGSGQGIAVAGLYCDYLDRNEQTTSKMLGAMLGHLVGRGIIPQDIRNAFEDAKEHFGGVGPRAPELLKMLMTAIAQQQRVVICIDGLDEGLAEHRTGILSSLQTIVRELPNVRLFLTGRPFIRGEIEKYFPGVDTISVSPAKEDIVAFLRMKLDRDTEPDAMDERLRADIMEVIPKKISQIFLLVSLSIDAILAEATIHRRKEKLKQVSKGQGVGDVYAATLRRIRAQKEDRSRLGMEAIMWVAYSERPLRPDELCQALGVEIGSNDLNGDNTPSIRTVLSCGLGLVTVDSSSSTVRLVHFTLQEYILSNSALFHRPHSVIAEVCLTYLNFGCIRDLSPTISSPSSTIPFLEYASCFWGTHARREASESVISLALELLNQFDTHIACKLLLEEHAVDPPFDIAGNPIGFSGLHCGAFLGYVEIMAALVEIKEWDLNATDLRGNTPLAWAARKGHSVVVKLLLEQEGVSPDKGDNLGQTPLSWAIENGHEEIAKMLLERNDVNPNVADESGQTPFSLAVISEYEGIVKMLLERCDVNPDFEDKGGRTPFSWAVRYSREGIAMMLLERNCVNPNAADESTRRPLSRAVRYGQGGGSEVQVERNCVNPIREDESGRTPFSWAAGNGLEGIVKLLLERNDLNPDTVDKSGRTPFSWAAGNGRQAIVKMLLARNDVNPDAADRSSRTPFSWATSNGHGGIAGMILERGGRTSFTPAAISRHEGTAEMQSEPCDIDLDIAGVLRLELLLLFPFPVYCVTYLGVAIPVLDHSRRRRTTAKTIFCSLPVLPVVQPVQDAARKAEDDLGTVPDGVDGMDGRRTALGPPDLGRVIILSFAITVIITWLKLSG